MADPHQPARVVCMVAHCPYVAEAAIEDFRVCLYHNRPSTRRILEDGFLPVDRFAFNPNAAPGPPLALEHLDEREAPAAARGSFGARARA